MQLFQKDGRYLSRMIAATIKIAFQEPGRRIGNIHTNSGYGFLGDQFYCNMVLLKNLYTE